MKKNHIAFLSFLLFYNSAILAQSGDTSMINAYLIAKKIIKFDLDSASVTSYDRKKLLGSIFWYANTAEISDQKLSSYPKLNAVTREIYTSVFTIESILSGFKNGGQLSQLKPDKKCPIIDTFLTRYRNWNTATNCLVALTDRDSMENLKAQNFRQKMPKKDILRTINAKATLIDDTTSKAFDSAYIKYADSLTNDAKKTDSEKLAISRKADSILGLIKQLYRDSSCLLEYLKNLIPVKRNVILYSPSSITEAVNVFNKSANESSIQLSIRADQGQLNSSFQIPSESQIIDALAIYIAGRVKQESVMWFFERITKNIKTYDLIKTFFPNTVSLLQSREVYEIPNMGSQWRYALSKDFINIPRNLFNSDWFKERLPDRLKKYTNYLLGACDLADLIEKRYNYRDVIKSLYLSDTLSNNDDIRFHDFISLLFAVNTELILPDNKTGLRLLKYEDFSSMSKDEIEVMLSLINLKYGKVISKFFNLGQAGKFQFGNDQDVERIRQFFGNIEIAISQLENISKEFIKEDKNKSSTSVSNTYFNTHDIWNSVDQLLNIFHPLKKNSLFSADLAKLDKAFSYIDEVHEIYGELNSRNFSGAVQTTLSFIDTLFYGARDEKAEYQFSFKRLDSTYHIFSSSYLFRDILNGVNSKDQKYICNSCLTFPLFSKPSMQLADIEKLYDFKVKDDSILFKKFSPMAAIVFEKDRHATDLIRKLAGFLNDAALSQSDKQLANVMQSYALPAGSYKRKRNNWWSLDFNAYAGPYIAREWVRDSTKSKSLVAKNGYVYGFSVPIGLSLSKTFGRKIQNDRNFKYQRVVPKAKHYKDDKNDNRGEDAKQNSTSKKDTVALKNITDFKKKNAIKKDSIALDFASILNPDKIKIYRENIYSRTGWTITLTASLIDLGAVVSYRLGNTGDSTLPQNVKWSQFISPGLHLAAALPQTPLVLGCGYEYTPQLRTFKQQAGIQYNATRLYFGLFFDIPLFNLWERNRIVYSPD